MDWLKLVVQHPKGSRRKSLLGIHPGDGEATFCGEGPCGGLQQVSSAQPSPPSQGPAVLVPLDNGREQASFWGEGWGCGEAAPLQQPPCWLRTGLFFLASKVCAASWPPPPLTHGGGKRELLLLFLTTPSQAAVPTKPALHAGGGGRVSRRHGHDGGRSTSKGRTVKTNVGRYKTKAPNADLYCKWILGVSCPLLMQPSL